MQIIIETPPLDSITDHRAALTQHAADCPARNTHKETP